MRPMRRIAILAEGSFGPFSAKTAVGVMRYSPDTVVAIVDSAHAGQTADQALGGDLGKGVPVVADVAVVPRWGGPTAVTRLARKAI